MRKTLSGFIRSLLGLALFVASLASAQTPVPLPVTGNLGTISGSPQPYAGVVIQLQNCPSPVSVTGYYGIVATTYQLQANASGQINSTVWANDQITCNGTTGASMYSEQAVVNGVPSGTLQCYQVVSTQGVWNLNGPQQPIACASTPPNPQDGFFRNLTSTGFFQGNNGAMSGTWTVGGLLSALGGVTLGTAPTSCSGSNFMTGLSITLQPVCSALPAGSGFLTSFNGRTTPAAVPTSGDYTYAQITNAPYLDFNGTPATVRQVWNFSSRFTGTDASPKTNIDLNAPGTGAYAATYASNPGASTAVTAFDGNGNIGIASLPGTQSATGYQYLPGGVLLEWVTSPDFASGTRQSQSVSWPIPFPHNLFTIETTVLLDNPVATNNDSYAFYVQPVGSTVTGCSLATGLSGVCLFGDVGPDGVGDTTHRAFVFAIGN